MKIETQTKINKLKSLLENAFKDLSFVESTHRYYVKGEPLETSTSGVIKNFYKAFNTSKQAERKVQQLLEVITKEEVLDNWGILNKLSTVEGTKTHVFGELYPFDRSIETFNNQELACKKWWDNMPSFLHPLVMEQTMYHFKYMFGGTADVTLFNEKTGNIILADYKTNKNLFNHFDKNMLDEWDFLLNESFSHYIIQLNIYKIMLEQIPGINVESMCLVYLNRDGNPQMYKIPEYKEITLKSLERVFNIAA
jgi:ATP-dependent exoDNAse (exonuclease V) beta subunit